MPISIEKKQLLPVTLISYFSFIVLFHIKLLYLCFPKEFPHNVPFTSPWTMWIEIGVIPCGIHGNSK